MKKLLTGLLLSTTLLTGCSTTTTTEMHMEVAPNVAPQGSCSDTCLMVKLQEQAYPTTWIAWAPDIKGFTYEPGYLYDITVIRTGTRGVIGDPPPSTYLLKQVNSKVASSEFKKPGDP